MYFFTTSFVILIISKFLLPLTGKMLIFALALTLKELIVALVPFIACLAFFRTFANSEKGFSKIVGIFIAVVAANLLSTCCGILIFNWRSSWNFPDLHNQNLELQPLFSPLNLNFIPYYFAIIMGVSLGLLADSVIKINYFMKKMQLWVDNLLQTLTLLLPIMTAGFLLKMDYEGTIWYIFEKFLGNIGWIFLFALCYILAVVLIFMKGNLRQVWHFLKNMQAAVLVGFSTMSSLAAIPISAKALKINGAKKSDLILPLVYNVHLVGDCFFIPMVALIISGGQISSLFFFLIKFVLTKFTVPAIPAGGIMVMLPILSEYFAFDEKSLQMITMAYIICDPLITATNVLGNGIFSLILEKKIFKDVAAKS